MGLGVFILASNDIVAMHCTCCEYFVLTTRSECQQKMNSQLEIPVQPPIQRLDGICTTATQKISE